MTSTEILSSLERERRLLGEFRSISEEQLQLIDDENIDGVDSLLGRRADLMIELTAIESTLGTWISQIRDNWAVTGETMSQLRSINDEIVEMAKEIVAIDAEAHWRLDRIHRRAQSEMRKINSRIMVRVRYDNAFPSSPSGFDFER